MPIHKGWIFKCPTCGETAVFFSSDYPAAMTLREATHHASDEGWHRNYGADWFCPACWERMLAQATPAKHQRKVVAP